MKVGYPCINRSLKVSSSRTFRLKSYSEERLVETVSANLDALQVILEYNVAHDLGFFRITSDLVPFASHPVCTFPWQEHFATVLAGIGDYIKANRMRISMHPDQFVLINAIDPGIVKSSIRELSYQADILDGMGLDHTARLQIHVGGVYGDRSAAMARFAKTYHELPAKIRNRLVIENDDRSYPLADCLSLHGETGVPVLFDVFHHSILNRGESVSDAIDRAAATWQDKDGILMMDYSSQAADSRKGSHTESIDLKDFGSFLDQVGERNLDLMLEIKDKEKSALQALELMRRLPQFSSP